MLLLLWNIEEEVNGPLYYNLKSLSVTFTLLYENDVCREAMGKHGEQYNFGNLRKAGIGNFVELIEAKRAFVLILV